MADTPAPDFIHILDVLLTHDVDFIIIGGVSAVLQGVPVTTIDLDIVHKRTQDNIERLLEALDELEAVSRLDSRRLRPKASHLAGAGHQLLVTNAGLLDILGTVAGEQDYDALLADTELLHLSGRTVRVLSLQRLLKLKTLVGRPKDLATIPLIQHTIDEKSRSDQ